MRTTPMLQDVSPRLSAGVVAGTLSSPYFGSEREKAKGKGRERERAGSERVGKKIGERG